MQYILCTCGRPPFVCPKIIFSSKDCFPYVPICIIHLLAFRLISFEFICIRKKNNLHWFSFNFFVQPWRCIQSPPYFPIYILMGNPLVSFENVTDAPHNITMSQMHLQVWQCHRCTWAHDNVTDAPQRMTMSEMHLRVWQCHVRSYGPMGLLAISGHFLSDWRPSDILSRKFEFATIFDPP